MQTSCASDTDEYRCRCVIREVVLPLKRRSTAPYAAPAMYRAMRPQAVQRRVTWQRGGGGESSGLRSMEPEQLGQLSGEPLRSLAMRCNACAGLYVAGRGLRIDPPDNEPALSDGRRHRNGSS